MTNNKIDNKQTIHHKVVERFYIGSECVVINQEMWNYSQILRRLNDLIGMDFLFTYDHGIDTDTIDIYFK